MSEDISLMKSQVEKQLDEYEQAVADYSAFMAEWRARNPPVELEDAPPALAALIKAGMA